MWEKRGKKDSIVKIFKKHASACKNTGNCCFGMSFLCCCCCCSLGASYVHMADIGTHWLTALGVYDSLSDVNTNKLFEEGMKLLEILKNRYNDAIREHEEKKNNASIEDYYSLQSRSVIMKYDIETDHWLHVLLKDVMNHVRYGGSFKYINVDKSEHELILKCLPMFQPVMQDLKCPSSLNAKEMEYIKALLIGGK